LECVVTDYLSRAFSHLLLWANALDDDARQNAKRGQTAGQVETVIRFRWMEFRDRNGHRVVGGVDFRIDLNIAGMQMHGTATVERMHQALTRMVNEFALANPEFGRVAISTINAQPTTP